MLLLLSKRSKGIEATIYTKEISQKLLLDLQKYNAQYSPLTIKEYKLSHDRFLILDEKEMYHFGASFKDLGKKCFACSLFDKETSKVLEKIYTEKT